MYGQLFIIKNCNGDTLVFDSYYWKDAFKVVVSESGVMQKGKIDRRWKRRIKKKVVI